MIRNTLIILIILIIGAAIGWRILENDNHSVSGDDHSDHGLPTADDAPAKGPNGGKLLSDGDFSVELVLYETGVPPEYHAYAYFDGERLDPQNWQLEIKLHRLGGQVDTIEFLPLTDYLRGQSEVTEPHSFSVEVSARYKDRTHQWKFDSFEGRTHIAKQLAEDAGIRTEQAGGGVIEERIALTGSVQADPNRISRVKPRYAGTITKLHKNLGERVTKGAALVSIRSHDSLQVYTLHAPIGGLILKRDVQVGESVTDNTLFVIADLSKVWVELTVYGQDLNRVQIGQKVSILTLDGQTHKGEIDWVSPLASHASQSVHARVIMDNPSGKLHPGQYVTANVTIAEHTVPLRVRTSALQGFRDFTVVFARFGEDYEVRMLELGKRNADWVEVTKGLNPGTDYVVENSFLIKADVEKSGASHDH